LMFNNVQENSIPNNVRVEFQSWKMNNQRSYHTLAEEQYRLNVFYQNTLYINSVNAAQNDYTLAINKFADMTREEFLAKFTSGPMRRTEGDESNLSTVGLPAHVDWRTKGAVTPIKNQGQCGSCWAFSTTGSLEGLNVISGGKLTSFSEQQLMDCSTSYGNEGCQGGLMDQAFQYVIANGIETEAQYPYKMQNEQCHSNPSDYVFHIKKYKNVGKYNNMQLQASVAQQPVSVAVDANALQFYSGGIITQGCGQQLDHGVLAVGYGTSSSGTKYWIVKNSWGVDWGMQGYFEVVRLTTSGPSQCGISEMASYPEDGSRM